MPTYVYETPTGRVDRYCAVEERDNVPSSWARITIPESLSVCFLDERPPQNVEVLNGFKQVEQRMGTSGLERSMGMKASEIKRIWERD